MFKSEAKLFLSANYNVNAAKTLINECKKLIVDFDLTGNSDCKGLKSNINNCDINSLVSKVEDTKESLMKLDQNFASEYMTLLQDFLQMSTIDTSNMTDEEKMQYSIQMNAYARDYNYNLLYILEKYEDSGMLTEEMKQQLEYQRELIAQYDIQDKMAVLDPTTDEYINLFKKNAEYDRKIINLSPNLTEKEKSDYLKEYDMQYNQNLEVLINARDKRLKRESDEKELEELYASKEDNNGFFHPFIESEIDEAILDKKIEMGIASDDEIAYKNMNGWNRFWTDTRTFLASEFVGLYGVLENIGDGLVTLTAGTVGLFNDDVANWTKSFVSKDFASELYDGIVLIKGLNSYSAYSTVHDVGCFVGEAVGTIGLQFLPGGNVVLVAAHGLKGMGSAAQNNFIKNPDASFASVYGSSFFSGAIEAASAYVLYGKSKIIKNSGITKVQNVDVISSKLPNVLKKINFGEVASGAAKSFVKVNFAGLKELARELATCPLDHEYDIEAAFSNAVRAMIIQSFNELIVGSFKTNKSNTSTKKNAYDTAKKEYYEIKAKLDKVNEVTDKLDDNQFPLSGQTTPNDFDMQTLHKQLADAYSRMTQNTLNIKEHFVDKFVIEPNGDLFSYTSKFFKKFYDQVGKEAQKDIF